MKVDSGMKTHSSQVSTPSVKRKRSMDNSEENVCLSSKYTTSLFDKNKHKSVDHGDPFAVRDWVLELDSSKYGSVTKDIVDLFSRRKQMLMPCFRRFPSLGPDTVELKSGKDSSVAAQLVVNIDSDDDESTGLRPFQPFQEVVLNKPTDQFSMKQFLEGDYAQGRASKRRKDRVTATEPSVAKDRSLQVDDAKGENKHDKEVHVGVAENRNVEDDDAKGKKEYDKGVHVGVAKEKSVEDVDADGEKEHDKGVHVGVAKERSVKDGDAKGKKKYDKGVCVGVAKERSVKDGDAKGEKKYDKRAHVGVAKERSVKDNDANGENKYDKRAHVGVAKERSVKDNDANGENKYDKGVNAGLAKDKSVEDDDAEGEDKHDKGVYVGVEDDDTDMEESDPHSDFNFDGLADIWKEMTVGLESSKDIDASSNEHANEDEEECDHSFILKEDIGYVCRVCGIIQRSIESIIEFQRPKSSKSIRTYHYESQSSKSGIAAAPILDGVKLPGTDFSVRELSAHPRHKKQMKPHQVEGFNFLRSNLVSENPGGCILAHAPGSGKTFMLISFIQSFMAMYPDARPLVILPRGILGTWKKEFNRWQIEDIPLFDLYSLKSDGRVNQFEVLKQWANQRSILFLGYQQFSSIVCDTDTSSISVSCQEILLTYPSILILDEGHTPRNQDTNILTSLEKVQTPRKVVLSGTLYQNHVKEVFNILNLVRPKFLRMEDSKVIKRRILSRVPIESRRNLFKKSTDNEFYEVVEHTLLKDDNFKRKVTVIEDLREMTSRVLHYYKGDFLDELPGLVDFSVFLNLSPKQKREVSELRKISRKFKISSDGSAIYVHPRLKSLTKNTTAKDKNEDNSSKIDELLENLDERDGVKAKFFLNMLRLCESGGEKLLVFGQYLLPLKFLMRMTMKVKGWSLNKQVFMITGDHDNDAREIAMDQFNNSSESRVFFGSIKACGEGISLVGASRIIILDVHLNPSVTRQAIGRAFRPGQVRKVYTYRLIAADSPEEEDHATCFKKESISKMWFEWNEFCGHHDFEMETVGVKDCGDQFLETSWLNEDITSIYKR